MTVGQVHGKVKALSFKRYFYPTVPAVEVVLSPQLASNASRFTNEQHDPGAHHQVYRHIENGKIMVLMIEGLCPDMYRFQHLFPKQNMLKVVTVGY